MHPEAETHRGACSSNWHPPLNRRLMSTYCMPDHTDIEGQFVTSPVLMQRCPCRENLKPRWLLETL